MLHFYKFTLLQKQNKLIHTVTTKSQQFPYQFSLALHTQENVHDIIQNRKILSKVLNHNMNIPISFIVANQTHSNHVKNITKAQTMGWNQVETAVSDCDALVTNIPNVILTILTADCVPILLYDQKKQVIAAVHAGWKGTKLQILTKTIENMSQNYGCNSQDIIAGIAPSIGRCCYEVNHDVVQHFKYLPQSFIPKKDKYMLDLPYINKQQLLDAGLKNENIEMSNICTSCEVQHFFSYRKEKGCSGRFMTMIGLKG